MNRLHHILADDTGAALVSIMMIVAVMSTTAVLAFDRLGNWTHDTSTHIDQTQARNYALAAELLAKRAAEDLAQQNARAIALIGQDQTISYDLDGGSITGKLIERSNCFNVNAVVKAGQNGFLLASETGMAAYGKLLNGLGIKGALANHLTATLTDWIDTDRRPLPMGAEDNDYLAQDTPYRAGNTMIAELSELRMIKGYTPALLAVLSPHVCASNETEFGPYNLSAMTETDAPVLMTLLPEDMTYSDTARLISRYGGPGRTRHIGDFWRDAAFAGKQIGQATRGKLALKASRYKAILTGSYYGAPIALVSEFQIIGGRKAVVTARQFGLTDDQIKQQDGQR